MIIETEVPDWARYKAQDSCGRIFIYESLPEKGKIAWIKKWTEPKNRIMFIGRGDPNPNWQEELYELVVK